MKYDPKQLPINIVKTTVLLNLNSCRVTIIVGETGSGKTTQVPQWALKILKDRGVKRPKIAVTQPRRISTRSVCATVRDQMGVREGDKVGYAMRFEDQSSDDTEILFATDGLMLKIAASDPALRDYGFIFIDEAHERTLATDILLSRLKDILSVNKTSLKLVIMSATIDTHKFEEYFDHPNITVGVVSCNVRPHPLQINYLKATSNNDLVDDCVSACIMIHGMNEEGDVLVFAAGAQQIHEICERIEKMVAANSDYLGPVACYPLYSEMPKEVQDRIFKPAPAAKNDLRGRKIIVATNYAESSITIPDVTYVVDGGKVRRKEHNNDRGLKSFIIVSCTQASAKQRAGRAGRTGKGVVYRLYSQHFYDNVMLKTQQPEMIRAEMAGTLLTLRAMEVRNMLTHDLMDTPSPVAVAKAQEDLVILEALDHNGALTEKGRMMAEFPQDPKWSSMVVRASRMGCVEEVMAIVSLYSVPTIFYRPVVGRDLADQTKREMEHPRGDLFTLLNVFKHYMDDPFRGTWCIKKFIVERSLLNACNEIKQMQRVCSSLGLRAYSDVTHDPAVENSGYYENITKVILASNIFQIAHCPSGARKYYILTQYYREPVRVYSGSMFAPNNVTGALPQWVCYEELIVEGTICIRGLTLITPEIIREVAPKCLKDMVKTKGGFVEDELRKILF